MAASVGSLVVQLGANVAQFSNDLKTAERLATNFTNKIGSTLKGLQAGFAGIIGVGFAREIGDAAERVLQLSDRLKIGTGDLQALQFAAGQSGLEFDALASGVDKMFKALDAARRGAAGASEPFDRLGISAQQFAQLSLPEQLNQLSEAFTRIDDPVQLSAAAIALFGKSGTDLLPFLRSGPNGIADLTARFRDLGLELDRGTLEKLDQTSDSLGELGLVMKKTASEAIAPFGDTLKALADVAGGVARVFGPVLNFVVLGFKGAVEAVGAALATFLGATAALLSNLPLVGDKFKAVADFAEDLANQYGLAAIKSISLAGGLNEVAKAQENVNRARAGSLQNPNDLGEITVSFSFKKAAAEAKRAADELARAIQQADDATQTATEKTQASIREFDANIALLLKRKKITRDEAAARTAEFMANTFPEITVDAKKLAVPYERTVDEFTEYTKQAAANIQDAFAQFFFDPFKGGLKGLVSSFANAVRQMVAQIAAAQFLKNSGLQGFITDFVSGIFGGTKATPQRAMGGPVTAGQTYLVGERGPEYFRPRAAGTIVPGGQWGAGITYAPVINIDSRADRQQVMSDVQRALQSNNRELMMQLTRYNPGIRT